MLGSVAWRGLHRLLIIFWKVPCIQQRRTWKQCWHKAEDWTVVIWFPSIHDNSFWIFIIALPPFTSSSLRLCPPHPHLSMLRSLALFLWEFEEFTSFHSFSVFLFLLLKLARYWEFRCHVSGVLADFAAVSVESKRNRKEASPLSVLFHVTRNIFPLSFFFECTPSVSTVYALLNLVHVSYCFFFCWTKVPWGAWFVFILRKLSS